MASGVLGLGAEGFINIGVASGLVGLCSDIRALNPPGLTLSHKAGKDGSDQDPSRKPTGLM